MLNNVCTLWRALNTIAFRKIKISHKRTLFSNQFYYPRVTRLPFYRQKLPPLTLELNYSQTTQTIIQKNLHKQKIYYKKIRPYK